jgi:hypothetical protein
MIRLLKKKCTKIVVFPNRKRALPPEILLQEVKYTYNTIKPAKEFQKKNLSFDHQIQSFATSKSKNSSNIQNLVIFFYKGSSQMLRIAKSLK